MKHDELTGKVPFKPKFAAHLTILYSEERVVGRYKVYLCVETNDTIPENQDYYGVHLDVDGGPFPCKIQRTFELVHHDWNPASAVKNTGESIGRQAMLCGPSKFISKARLASPDNNPYVKDGYVTFTCTFKFV